ncbi:hypothetical protein PINS_up011168 [Pythium insidiosum]|nr:hypothetical protein PINS_up011168 [Pythium insidiosum]
MIEVGDIITAVNGKSIVNLHQTACFSAIRAASIKPSLNDGSGEEKSASVQVGDETFSLTFLQPSISLNMREASAGNNVYEAEWNRRVLFIDEASVDNTPHGDCTNDNSEKGEKALVRVYLRNEIAEHGLSAAQESSVVPFLYFFGDDDMMDHLDHSKQDTRFDTLIGECWVSVPSPSTVQDDYATDEESSKAQSDSICALYAPIDEQDHGSSTGRRMVGQVRLALRWDYKYALALARRREEELRCYVHLELQGLFVSIVDDGLSGMQRHARELLSVSLSSMHADNGIQLSYGNVSDGRHVLNVRVGHLQVDNQLMDTNYPVMMYPIRLVDSVQLDHAGSGERVEKISQPKGFIQLPSDGNKTLLPTFQLMTVFSKRSQLIQFEYVFAQLQELDVKLEDAILVATAQAFTGINWSRNHSADDDMNASATRPSSYTAMALLDERWPFPISPTFPVSALKVEFRGGQSKVLLRWLLLCPIKLNVTFTSTTDRSNLLSLLSPDMSSALRTIISAAAALVSNLDNAPIKIPEFYVENLLETTHTLAFYTIQHYFHHGLRSWYRIVGSVDFLGNPIGLVSALGTGVKDFFYTPAQMLLEDENGLRIENLRTGMTKGSKSLFRNTAVGIFHTTGKITETLGKGVALLAMDEQYNVQRQRHTNKQKKRINDLGDAIAEGGKGLVGGVWDGVKGVVMAPVRGAERDGAGGFVVGIGQGVAGLFVKPTAGFLDMLTSLSRGAKTSAQAIDGDEHGYSSETRVRLPRRICLDGVLVSYSEREARGCAILALTSLDATDDYVFHLDYGIEGQQGILLLTDKRVICLSAKSGQKLWELALDSSLHVQANGVMLSIGQSQSANKVYNIECEHESAASNFQLAVTSARLDLGATRYLLLNMERKQEVAQHNAMRGLDTDGDDRVDINLLMGNLQDPMVTGLSEQDLQCQPLRSVQVELCHLENKDASANLFAFFLCTTDSFRSAYSKWSFSAGHINGVYSAGSANFESCTRLLKPGAIPWMRSHRFLRGRSSPALALELRSSVRKPWAFSFKRPFMHASISSSPPMLHFLTHKAQEIRVSLPPLSPNVASSWRGTVPGGPDMRFDDRQAYLGGRNRRSSELEERRMIQ